MAADKPPPKPKKKKKLTPFQKAVMEVKEFLASLEIGPKIPPPTKDKAKKVHRVGPDRRKLEADALKELEAMDRAAQEKAKKRKKK